MATAKEIAEVIHTTIVESAVDGTENGYAVLVACSLVAGGDAEGARAAIADLLATPVHPLGNPMPGEILGGIGRASISDGLNAILNALNV